MYGRVLKYPRKVVIDAHNLKEDLKPILDFAEKYKRGAKSKVVMKKYENPSFIRGARIPRVEVIFYTYEPIGLLREKFHDDISKSDFIGNAFIEGWLFNFPARRFER